MKRKFFYILISIYNEEKNITKLIVNLIKLFKKKKVNNFKILIIDDGSTDTSQVEVIKLERKFKKVSYLFLKKNIGKEKAIMLGFKSISNFGKYEILVMDGDGQHQPKDALKLYRESIHSNGDIICGVRTSRLYQSFLERIFSYFFYKIFNIFSHTKLDPNVGDFNYFKYNAVKIISEIEDLNPLFKEIIQNLNFNLKKINIFINNEYHKKKTNFIYKLFLANQSLLNNSIFILPASLFISISSIIFGISYILNIFYKHFFLFETVPGYTSIMIVMIFYFSINTLILTFFGYWIYEIHKNIRKKNYYIISKKKFN
tara:strand:- start:1840 stop:2784 length:945 start_codon:yes stop_codon:yes gene_type:complete